MKRLTLLLLLATTAICYGQTSEEVANSIGSSDVLADPVVTESSYIDELEQLDRQSNEASQRHLDAITRREEIEILKQRPQQDNTAYPSIRTKYNSKTYSKQHERSSAVGIGQHSPDRHSTSYHTMTSAPLHNNSQNDYHRASSNNVRQSPK
jgi:hypothetical protein